jgi:hypothetical protein
LRSDSGGAYRAKGVVVKKKRKEKKRVKKTKCVFKILFLNNLNNFIFGYKFFIDFGTKIAMSRQVEIDINFMLELWVTKTQNGGRVKQCAERWFCF